MSNMPAPFRPCHTAQHSVFRSRPLDTTVVGHSLRFALEYEGLGGAWLPVAWRLLAPVHGSSLHLVITSNDGDDYYHVHPQGTGEDGIVTAEVQFRRAGSHLVASSWAVKAEDLGVCVAEHVSHAHTADNNGTYPMITTAWRIEVVDTGLPGAKAAPAPALPPHRTEVCLKQGVSWDDDRAEALGLVGIDSSYAPGQSAACCAASAGEEECAALCTGGGGCLQVAARMKCIPGQTGCTGWLSGEERLDETHLPAGECLAVEFEVSGADGSPATLQPYLGAAAHIFIASAAGGEPAAAVQPAVPAVVHAHAYASMDVERLGGDGALPDLSRVLCEDYYQTGTYPMPAVPAAFGPRLYALVRLPSTGAWRVYVSLRHDDQLATAAFEWHATASPKGKPRRGAPPPPSPPPLAGTVVLTLTASGSVNDYTDSDKSSLQQKVANVAGVDEALVTISVAAASVRITATIAVPASMAPDAVQASLSSTLGTAADASAALGIVVEDAPTVALADDPAQPPNDMSATYAAVAASVGVLCLVLLGALGWAWRRRLQRREARAGATSSSHAAAADGARGTSKSVELQGPPPKRAEPITHVISVEAVDAGPGTDAEKC